MAHTWKLLLFLVSSAFLTNAAKRECFVDDEGDKMDPNNIYKCDMSRTCCKEEGKSSCCAQKETNQAISEQFQLWGTLLGFLFVLGLLMWFCRHDGDCCCNAKDGRHSCCGKAYGKRPEDHYIADPNQPILEEEDEKKQAKELEAKDTKNIDTGIKTVQEKTDGIKPDADLALNDLV